MTTTEVGNWAKVKAAVEAQNRTAAAGMWWREPAPDLALAEPVATTGFHWPDLETWPEPLECWFWSKMKSQWAIYAVRGRSDPWSWRVMNQPPQADLRNDVVWTMSAADSGRYGLANLNPKQALDRSQAAMHGWLWLGAKQEGK